MDMNTDDFFVMTDNDLRVAVKTALDRIGMTWAALEFVARHDRSSLNELERVTWTAIQDLGDYAER